MITKTTVHDYAGSIVKEGEMETPENIFINKEGQPRFWVLFYGHRNSVLVQKGFRFDGTLNQAMIRGRAHCEVLGYRFIRVRPLIVDLDYQEKLYQEGKFRDQEVNEI